MAKGYVIGHLNIHNPEGYQAYAAQVPPTLTPFGGRFIVRGGAVHVFDGEPLGPRNVVIEFPSVQSAKDWYASPAYQAIVNGRIQNAKGYLMVVEGFEAA
ncbi:MAG: hypothetical protein RLY67_979 [Pseudomonadota bacterium]|jgi:uncharacterized protein (DUF1330 family)